MRIKSIFWLGLLALGGYGGYYGYNAYEVRSGFHELGATCGNLRQDLLALDKTITVKDLRRVIERYARRVDGRVGDAGLRLTIEPLTEQTMSKLPGVAQTALSLVPKIPGHRQPRWLVGIEANVRIRRKVASKEGRFQCYTWSDDATPPEG
jgi:hypothetical protein